MDAIYISAMSSPSLEQKLQRGHTRDNAVILELCSIKAQLHPSNSNLTNVHVSAMLYISLEQKIEI